MRDFQANSEGPWSLRPTLLGGDGFVIEHIDPNIRLTFNFEKGEEDDAQVLYTVLNGCGAFLDFREV